MRIVVAVIGIWAWCLAALAQDISDQQMKEMLEADVVILGEIHDNPAHHLGQAQMMRRIEPTAVVFEMLTPEMAQAVGDWGRVDLAGLGERIGWEAAGWPAFAMYLPVFEALGDAKVVGAALPRAQVRAAFTEGAAGVFGTQAARFGLNDPLPEAQRARRAQMQFDAHCAAMPLEMMDGMIEAQRLRDAEFSRATLDALEQFGAPVVVITGNGHARKDWGMPFVMARAAPQVSVFAVGFVEAPEGTDTVRFDATVPTPAAIRGDPCAAFKTQ